jgi:alcohol dehydrogenase class IV
VVAQQSSREVDVVVAVGGGAVVDAGKAISAMLPLKDGGVKAYLEGVGHRHHPGIKKPFIAVPTTAGTGSEATKNAVISERIGPNGFKKSLRHDNFVPDAVVLDPQLSSSCPPALTAACGLDALTQLVEAFVSHRATPLTDALAWSGLEAVLSSLVPVATDRGDDLELRAKMSYGAFLSGVTLAHAGLGVVHGFASPLGGSFEIPHGVVCATLLSPATEANLAVLLNSPEQNPAAIQKYARIGRFLAKDSELAERDACWVMVETLRAWTARLGVPLLGDFGIVESALDGIVAKTGLKNNPVNLDRTQLRSILETRL